jgi:hypothetical protein
VGVRFSTRVQTGSGTHPTSYTMGTGPFPEVRRPGCGINHTLPPSAEGTERLELLSLLPFCALMAGYRVNFTFYVD